MSESDHRLSRVEDWSASHLGVLRAVLDCPSLRSLDFADDRLGRLLDRYLDRLPENLADLDYVQINRDKAVDQPQNEENRVYYTVVEEPIEGSQTARWVERRILHYSTP